MRCLLQRTSFHTARSEEDGAFVRRTYNEHIDIRYVLVLSYLHILIRRRKRETLNIMNAGFSSGVANYRDLSSTSS